jgi:CheY-like chemotaxis protein
MVRAIHKQSVAEAAAGGGPAGGSTKGRATPPSSEATILVLTRDVAARDHLMEIAIERGYGLCCQTDGGEAVRVLTLEPPGLLVVDMDAKGGRELLRTVRAHAEWRLIPLLALTATNNPMIAVTADAPTFFMPEMSGLEQAIASRLEPAEEA